MTTNPPDPSQPEQHDEPERGGIPSKPPKGKKVVKRYRSQIREVMNRNVVVTSRSSRVSTPTCAYSDDVARLFQA